MVDYFSDIVVADSLRVVKTIFQTCGVVNLFTVDSIFRHCGRLFFRHCGGYRLRVVKTIFQTLWWLIVYE